jgi:hypothetical protein
MSVSEKQAASLSRMREPHVTCPACDTQTTERDILAHVATRCPGPREPGPRAAWIDWRSAIAAGVPKRTLSFWVERGDVRFRGNRGDRRYLLRDLVLRLAQRRTNRRR